MTKLHNIHKNKLRTLVTTYRGDARTIATLALFWISKGEAIHSINDILKLSTEALKELIIDAKPEFEIDTTTKAIETLESLGVFNIQGKIRNKSTLLKELSIEDLMAEGAGGVPGVTTKYGPFKSLQEKEKFEGALEDNIMEGYQTGEKGD